MQDLTSHLATWKATLRGTGNLSAADIAELESHLLDAVAELQSKGLAADEAFFIAQRRLGGADVLADEFAKSNPAGRSQQVLLWMLCGIFGYFVINLSFDIISQFINFVLIAAFGLKGMLGGEVVRALGFASFVVLFWKASTGRGLHLEPLMERLSRLRLWHLLAGLVVLFLLKVAGTAGMMYAMRSCTPTDISMTSRIVIYTSAGTTLLLFLAIPVLIQRLRPVTT